ncbi:hypothetical protein HYR99_41265, partial [Candidatus Poribacteria bacterium]|nr:hypothetical protein [Candidatus Poribacteria bacterium]
MAKIDSTQRAQKLAKSVTEGVWVPSQANRTHRQDGWVAKPHRYSQKTLQVAVFPRNETGQWTYAVWVTTCLDARLFEIVTDYDQPPGATANSHFVGADIWAFFRDSLEDCLMKSEAKNRETRNVLFILTDGYLDFDPKVQATRPRKGNRT